MSKKKKKVKGEFKRKFYGEFKIYIGYKGIVEG
jgi:hypothetical protein